jgi:tripartite-type tricarboxylate transporter receptor subunit TctC
MRHIMRAAIIAMLILALASACARSEAPGNWPSRPVTVVVPFGAGSGTDLVARLIVPRLSERWRQAVVVDNRPGADGIVGVQAFVSAKDHHTLLFTPAGQVTLSPLLHERMPFDPVRDLVPTAAVVTPSICIGIASGLNAASLADLAALARRQPGALLWAAPPGLPEVMFRAFLAIEKLDMKHVPYRDLSMAVQDLAAGRTHIGVFAVPTLMPQVQAGAVRLLVVTTGSRIAAAPHVPTSAEAGYPLLSADGRWGFYGWRDIPTALRDRISEDVRHALDDQPLRERLLSMGLTVSPGSAEEFGRALEVQRGQVHEIARLIGLKPASVGAGR